MPPCPPPHRRPNIPPWRRHRPPFGLHRQIYWSLVGAMVVASGFTLLVSLVWTRGVVPSGWMGVGFVGMVLGMLWLASGRLAYRLVRPLNTLVDVVQRFGDGDLTARARVTPRARDEVARVAHAIDQMADRIERQVREERQLLAVVSHELRTPLARIRVLTELVRDGQLTALGDIDREVEEVDDLVSKVLARSRLAFGTIAPRLVHMLDAVAEALERQGLSRSVLDARDAVADGVMADPTLLHRAIANLLDNAQKHGGGVVGVSVRSSDTGVAVEVSDAGRGFPSGDPSTRFSAFGPDESGTRGAGLGLGLHLVEQIVTAHHGRAWAENRAGGGAHVGFELPHAPNTGP